jgi:hypothetical protein
MDTDGKMINAALEHAWGALMETVPDLPPARISTGVGRGPQVDPSKVPADVWISDQWLDVGPRTTLAVLAHEACHLIAWVRGLQDTSRGGEYHGQLFGEIALELRFKAVANANRTRENDYGLPVLKITKAGELFYYAEVLENLASVLPADGPEDWVDAPFCRPRRIKRGGTNAGVKITCDCDEPFTFRMPYGRFTKARMRCEWCNKLFHIWEAKT